MSAANGNSLDSLVGRFDVIYADPPWRYSFSKSRSRDIENQYSTMTIDDICALRVPARLPSVGGSPALKGGKQQRVSGA